MHFNHFIDPAAATSASVPWSANCKAALTKTFPPNTRSTLTALLSESGRLPIRSPNSTRTPHAPSFVHDFSSFCCCSKNATLRSSSGMLPIFPASFSASSTSFLASKASPNAFFACSIASSSPFTLTSFTLTSCSFSPEDDVPRKPWIAPVNASLALVRALSATSCTSFATPAAVCTKSAVPLATIEATPAAVLATADSPYFPSMKLFTFSTASVTCLPLRVFAKVSMSGPVSSNLTIGNGTVVAATRALLMSGLTFDFMNPANARWTSSLFAVLASITCTSAPQRRRL